MVVGLDHHFAALRSNDFNRSMTEVVPAAFVCGESRGLPFANETFDLVFCQLALMWMPLEQTVTEIARVTMAGGVVVAIEPDYGGMLEWPEGAGLKEIWISGLERAGADPLIGRKLPGAFARQGFEVRVETMPGIQPPALARFGLLRGLPLTPDEERRVDEVEKRSGVNSSPWDSLVHLPFVMVIGTRL